MIVVAVYLQNSLATELNYPCSVALFQGFPCCTEVWTTVRKVEAWEHLSHDRGECDTQQQMRAY